LDFVFENNFGQRVEYSIVFGGKSVEENEEWIPDNFALLKMGKNMDEMKKISEEMKPISREMISISWEIRENHSRDEIRFSRDRFKLPRDEIYLLWDENEKRIFENNLSRDENRLLGDFFYLIYVFGGNLYERGQRKCDNCLIIREINDLREKRRTIRQSVFEPQSHKKSLLYEKFPYSFIVIPKPYQLPKSQDYLWRHGVLYRSL
jgi:hypothetical protein